MTNGNGIILPPGVEDQREQEGGETPGLLINAQYLKDFSFENPSPIENMLNHEEQPETNVAVEVEINPLQETTFEVVLKTKATVTRQSGTVYLAELDYAGIFTLSGMSEEIMQFLLFVECPRLLFPFVRSLIAQVTQESGFPPLYLKPIDFADLLRQRLEQAGAFQNITDTPVGNA